MLHVALRGEESDGFAIDGRPVGPDVSAVLEAMSAFATSLRDGSRTGATGKAFTDVVNIGIGGSDLGPVMVTLALAPFHDGPRAHFVSNVDSAHIADTLKGLDPETTLFIVASKTFTTIETMTNAATARAFVAEALGEAAVAKHFAAVSTALDKVAAFGIDPALVFGFWDWVGGRYSVWSAVGLPVMIAVGPENFRALPRRRARSRPPLQTAPLEENLPVLLGLVGWWHRVAQGYPARAILPYDQRLLRAAGLSPAARHGIQRQARRRSTARRSHADRAARLGRARHQRPARLLPAHPPGHRLDPGRVHRGRRGHEPDLAVHHDLLLANCLAQSEALMVGRTLEEARRQLLDKGIDAAEAERLAPHRASPATAPRSPSSTRRSIPIALGRLVALYEHRVFVEAQLFGINAFDQWGVELGKELATGLLPVVQGQVATTGRDGSTAGLVRVISEMRKTS